MNTHIYAETPVQVDPEGYLAQPGQWTPPIGEAIAAELGVTLGPDHWEVINFAREDHADSGKSPGLRRVTQRTSVKMKRLYQLFPGGPGKKLARIAGIPKPKSCL